MPDKFLELAVTNSVRSMQQHYYGAAGAGAGSKRDLEPDNDVLSEEELAFIQSRDSFYIATVSEKNWPYVQHRGGPKGFLKVLTPKTLGFADFKGNRQLLSAGNLAVNDRVCLFLMDYPQRTRLKLLGHARVMDAREHPEMVEQLATPETRRSVERVFLIEVVSFNWNCSQHIKPRYTAEEISDLVAPLKQRITELEQQLKAKT